MKFTFKTDKPTGKWRSFEPTFHYIKLKGKEVGTIDDKSPHKIRVAVIKDDINEDGNPNCEWKWCTLKGRFDSVEAAKIYLTENADKIQKELPLYKFDY